MLTGIVVGVVSTVIGGLLVAWLLAVATSKRATKATASCVIASLPMPCLNGGSRSENVQALAAQEHLTWLNAVLPYTWGDDPRLRVVSICVSNPRKERSGSIEAIEKSAILWHHKGAYTVPSAQEQPFPLGTLDPHQKTIVTLLVPEWQSFHTIRILEDGKIIPLRLATFDLDPGLSTISRMLIGKGMLDPVMSGLVVMLAIQAALSFFKL